MVQPNENATQLLNTLNRMATMEVLAKQGDWEALQLLEKNWLEDFVTQLKASEELSEIEKQQVVQSVMQHVDLIAENAKKAMSSLQVNRLKELQSLDSVNHYLDN